MDYLALALRWLHILPAVTLAGGVIFMRFPLAPAAGEIDEPARLSLEAAVRRRWSKVVMITSAFLIVTGLVNAVRIIKSEELPMLYHAMVAVKLLLALGLMMISSLLAGRTSLAEKLRQKSLFWMNINLVLAVALVLVGGYMRGLHSPPVFKAEDEDTTAHVEQFNQHSSGEFALWTRKTRNV